MRARCFLTRKGEITRGCQRYFLGWGPSLPHARHVQLSLGMRKSRTTSNSLWPTTLSVFPRRWKASTRRAVSWRRGFPDAGPARVIPAVSAKSAANPALELNLGVRDSAQQLIIYAQSARGTSEQLHSRIHCWSPSYFAGSCGGAPLSVIAEYIRNQRGAAPPPRPKRRGFRARELR